MSKSKPVLPPSALYVEYVLSIRDGSVSRQTLLDETGLNESTLREALRTLRDRERIRRISGSLDAREAYYVLSHENNQ